MGIPHTDGSGILMSVAAGGGVRGMEGLIATASIYPPGQLVKGIIVNRLGKRFVAEDSYHGRTASFIMEQPQHRAMMKERSEEHTSELQSLMRISYAVFCLKKK